MFFEWQPAEFWGLARSVRVSREALATAILTACSIICTCSSAAEAAAMTCGIQFSAAFGPSAATGAEDCKFCGGQGMGRMGNGSESGSQYCSRLLTELEAVGLTAVVTSDSLEVWFIGR